jgi:hypothetical protein
MAKRQIVGGNFQDAAGNPLAYGYLTFRLVSDGSGSLSQVVAGILVTVPLDVNGNVAESGDFGFELENGTGVILLEDGVDILLLEDQTGDDVELWVNSSLLPSGTVYRIKAYSAAGQLAWQSENVIPAGAGAYDLGTLAPLVY